MTPNFLSQSRMTFLGLLAAMLTLVALIFVTTTPWIAVTPVHRSLAVESLDGTPVSSGKTATTRVDAVEYHRLAQGGTYYDKLQYVLDFPGVMGPQLFDLDAVNLPDSAPVVGVEIDGFACAFAIDSLLHPTKHVVNTMMNGLPISVTYCDKADTVRVLSCKGNSPIDLHVGGLDINDQMVLLLKGERFAQESDGLPLDDQSHVRTTLGEWKKLHADSKVYMLPESPSSQGNL
ncbi:MAG: DUF3179 domain-containing protein [Pirellulaceae bacterium]|nr:DUF3179 domain-containing protein [Pirellulaceae bacterium]